MNRRVLLVDDDTNLLSALRRQLRRTFDVETADGGRAALELIQDNEPFAVIVSDMQMPEMNGVEFLRHAQEESPDSIRLMLTGNADQQTASDAINAGRVFRFLNKPCTPDQLIAVVNEALEHYRLVNAERELLEGTVRGSVQVMTEILSLASPVAFSRASRVERLVAQACGELELSSGWEVEIAAMMSQLGCITIPDTVLERAFAGEPVSPSEVSMLRNLSQASADLIARIPRLESVAEIVARCDTAPAPDLLQPHDPVPEDWPIELRILQAAFDFELLQSSGLLPADVSNHLSQHGRVRDPAILSTLEEVAQKDETRRSVLLDELACGQVLAEDVLAADGSLLVGRGHEVTGSLILRLSNFSEKRGIQEPLQVIVDSSNVEHLGKEQLVTAGST